MGGEQTNEVVSASVRRRTESQSAIQIRKAAPDDVPWLMFQLRQFAEFYDTKRSLFGAEDYVRQGLIGIISKHPFLIAYRSDDNEPIGFVAGIVAPHMFNPEIRVLAETFWWVDPEHRESRAALLLLNAFVAWGKENADWITLSAIEGRTTIKEESIVKRGFRMYERTYLMEVER